MNALVPSVPETGSITGSDSPTTMHKVAPIIFRAFHDLPDRISTTIVGSVADRMDLAAASDMDVVIVCRHLTRAFFDQAAEAARGIAPADLGLPHRRLHVNMTFGPRKFDSNESATIHLMIYDLAGHREHVLRSPFTCYDWERSTLCDGPSLTDLYPVLSLQPRDLFDARRGTRDYLDDLSRGVLTCRSYQFTDGSVRETTESIELDARHQGEFAYHVARNLLINFCKIVSGTNRYFGNPELAAFCRETLPTCAGFMPSFLDLAERKAARQTTFPPDTVPRVRQFVADFEDAYRQFWGAAGRAQFIRHGRTALNDGSFLGQRRDPPVEDVIRPMDPTQRPDRVFSSPLRRATDTAQKLAPGVPVTTDARLSEIDYGAAEGLDVNQVRSRHPAIAEAWDQGADPRFPGGENTADVSRRLAGFLDEVTHFTGTTLVVTHNVVLRGLVGRLYRIPKHRWWRIPVGHLETLETLTMGGRIYPNFGPETKARITDATYTPQ